MDDTLVVNFAAMEHASLSIQSALGTLQSRLDEVDQLGKRLITTWSGEAREAYFARQSGWLQAAGDLALILKDIKAALDDSMRHYVETENRNRGLFQPR